jgi:hypothetical protein
VARIKIVTAVAVLGGAVVLVPGGAAQAAVITPAAGVEIKAAHSNKCLNIKGGTTDNDVPLVQYNCSDSFTNDKFKVVPSGTGTYQIIATFDNKCLNVYKGADTNNTPVHQYTCSTATNSLWKFVPVTDKGTFRIVSADSGKCLNVYDGSQDINTAVNIYTCGTSVDTLNDQFYFPPATSPAGVAAPAVADSPVVAVQGGAGNDGVGPLVYSFTADTGNLFTGYQKDPSNFSTVIWQSGTEGGSFTTFAGHPTENVQADGRVVTAAQNTRDGDLDLSTQTAVTGQAFGDWQDVGGSNPGGGAQPVTAKLPGGKLVTFAIIGGSLWHLPQDGVNLPYGAWRNIGGADLTGEISTSVTPTGLRIFALDTTGAVETALYADGKLGAFTSLGGTGFTGRIGVGERAGYLSRLVMRASDGSVVTKSETSDGVFESDWTTIPGVTAAGNPSIIGDPASDRAVIVVRSPDGTHYSTEETSEASGQWLPWTQTDGPALATDPTLFTFSNGNSGGVTVAYVGRDGSSKGWVFTLQSPTGLAARSKSLAATKPAFVGHTIGAPPAS